MPESMAITLDTVVTRLPDLIFTEVDSDLVILSITNSKYYGAGVVGQHIWKMIEQPMPVREVCRQLSESFNVDQAICERETLEFVQQLLTEKLIEIKSA